VEAHVLEMDVVLVEACLGDSVVDGTQEVVAEVALALDVEVVGAEVKGAQARVRESVVSP